MSLPTPKASDSNKQISELITLIKNATETIESHFLKSSLPIIPSLDSLAHHPLDSAILPPQLRDAVQLLEGACGQLCATLARPNHIILNFFEPTCLNVVTAFKIPDILQEQPSGMHIKEIGEKAGVNYEKLGRILRLLTTHHIFREVMTDRFANNRLSLQLLSSNPLASMVSFYTSVINKATSMTVEVLADPEWGNAQTFDRSPWNRYTGFEGPMFQYLDGVTPEGAQQGALLGIGMHGWNDVVQASAVYLDFPWDKYPPGTTVNDVGGGIGSMAMELIKAYPNLQLKLQDLPDRIHQAETEIWPKFLPSAIAEKQIEFKAMDFFVDSPIEGCDIYYVAEKRHVSVPFQTVKIGMRPLKLDTIGQTEKVFKFFATSVESSSLVLAFFSVHHTDEYVLQHANQLDTSNPAFPVAPKPMLPNYGAGRIRQYNLDLALMATQNSRGRTLEEFIDIASKADLQFVKLWYAGEMGMVEFQAA
ncbi:Sterigmatocystin 8-O-methyltransferase [Termitomyces sp. J132]|nr:Sterigmatocystin 8-O-methyltransferase [Termitomyces sp. J132]